jgi:hypothetical protein
MRDVCRKFFSEISDTNSAALQQQLMSSMQSLRGFLNGCRIFGWDVSKSFGMAANLFGRSQKSFGTAVNPLGRQQIIRDGSKFLGTAAN